MSDVRGWWLLTGAATGIVVEEAVDEGADVEDDPMIVGIVAVAETPKNLPVSIQAFVFWSKSATGL